MVMVSDDHNNFVFKDANVMQSFALKYVLCKTWQSDLMGYLSASFSVWPDGQIILNLQQ